MKLRIVSDGTPNGTHVEDSEAGERVENVTGIEWSIRIGGLAIADIRLSKIEVSVEGEVSDVYSERP